MHDRASQRRGFLVVQLRNALGILPCQIHQRGAAIRGNANMPARGAPAGHRLRRLAAAGDQTRVRIRPAEAERIHASVLLAGDFGSSRAACRP